MQNAQTDSSQEKKRKWPLHIWKNLQLDLWDTQIKIIPRYFSPIELVKTPKIEQYILLATFGASGISHIAGGSAKWYSFWGEELNNMWQNHICIYSLTQLLGKLIKYIFTSRKQVCPKPLIAELSVIAKDWKYKCPSVRTWLINQ